MFHDGVRVHQWSTKNLLPMSGKLITEFDRRRNIRDMFSRKPSLPTGQSSNGISLNMNGVDETPEPMSHPSKAIIEQSKRSQPTVVAPIALAAKSPPTDSTATKRSQKETSLPVAKRAKSASQPTSSVESTKGQKSLKGFFPPKISSKPTSQSDGLDGTDEDKVKYSAAQKHEAMESNAAVIAAASGTPTPSPARSEQSTGDSFIDPIVSKESWGKLFVKPVAPKCEHDEPCKTMLTKKTGVNCGRSFWMCARPLGPSGNKERGTQWRCSTFIWASDWNAGG